MARSLPALLSSCACLLLALALAAPASADYRFLSQFGATSPSSFSFPSGVATAGGQPVGAQSDVDAAGDVYVADTGNYLVKKFRADGTFVMQFGGQQQFGCGPKDVAVDPHGDILVADPCMYGIQRFAPDGTFVARIGDSGPDELTCATGVDTDAAGNVYVSMDNRCGIGEGRVVEKFSADGTFLWSVGGYRTGDHPFQCPSGLAVTPGGSVYVADQCSWAAGASVQEFDADGGFVRAFGDDDLHCAFGVAVGADGTVYVTDLCNADNGTAGVHEFSADGHPLGSWGSAGRDDGQLECPYGVTADAQDHIYVADTCNHRIQEFRADGAFLTKWGYESHTGEGEVDGPTGMAADRDGSVYVANNGGFSTHIDKYAPDGRFLSRFGSRGVDDGQLVCPSDVAIGPDGDIYVSDCYPWNGRAVQRFRPDGTFVQKFGDLGNGPDAVNCPSAVTVDVHGNVYVSDNCPYQTNAAVKEFDAAGSVVRTFGTYGSDESQGQLICPSGVAVDARGTVYVGGNCADGALRTFRPDGSYAGLFGRSYGHDGGSLVCPGDIATDGGGNLYVVDHCLWPDRAVQKFTPNGDFVAKMGAIGSGDGQFSCPNGVAVSASGTVVYADDGCLDRVEIFSEPPSDAAAPVTSAARSAEPNAAGWNQDDVTISLHAVDEDGGSGVEELTYSATGAQAIASTTAAGDSASIAVHAEGETTIHYAATDNAGNAEAQKTITVKIDNHAPQVDCAAADGTWHGADVSRACTASDAVSGLADGSDATFGLSTSVADGAETADASTGSRAVCDAAGRCATAGPLAGNKVDRRAPDITITRPTAGDYVLGTAVAADYGCADAGSQVAGCTGTVAAGQSVATGSIGAKTFKVVARDQAGNERTRTVDYRVVFPWSGFFQPIDNLDPATGRLVVNSVKAGSAVPVKFSLGGDRGLAVFDTDYPHSQAIECDTQAPVDAVTELATSTTSGLKYDASARQYNYTWKTSPTFAGSCRQLIVKLTDGTYHRANFMFPA